MVSARYIELNKFFFCGFRKQQNWRAPPCRVKVTMRGTGVSFRSGFFFCVFQWLTIGLSFEAAFHKWGYPLANQQFASENCHL